MLDLGAQHLAGLNPRMTIHLLGQEINSHLCFFQLFSPETGIALYPGKAQLLSCKHHYYDHIPPLINPGQPGEIECTTQRINYTDPFTNQTMVIIKKTKEQNSADGVVLCTAAFQSSSICYPGTAVKYLLSFFLTFFEQSVLIFRNVKDISWFILLIAELYVCHKNLNRMERNRYLTMQLLVHFL